jgi:hypothetical protein
MKAVEMGRESEAVCAMTDTFLDDEWAQTSV